MKSSRLITICLALALCAAAARPALAANAAVLSVRTPADSRDLILELAMHPDSETTAAPLSHTVPAGLDELAEFETWYEELFALTYLTGDNGRLWKQLRTRTAAMSKKFLSDEMIAFIRGAGLLIVADSDFPFPADVLRVEDKWLFEIAPIVHTAGVPGKIPDLTDDYKYRNVFVMDCQGPADREGQEAPGVAAFLQKTGIEHTMALTLDNESAAAALRDTQADVLHLATHAQPDEFFPGRGKTGIPAAQLKNLPTRFRTVLSTGCNTGHPVFADAMLDDGTRFYIASMYKTSGKDGIRFGSDFYSNLFSGMTPFQAFYEVKRHNITGSKSSYPDILRFVFYVK
jgi:hypothetical protein